MFSFVLLISSAGKFDCGKVTTVFVKLVLIKLSVVASCKWGEVIYKVAYYYIY